ANPSPTPVGLLCKSGSCLAASRLRYLARSAVVRRDVPPGAPAVCGAVRVPAANQAFRVPTQLSPAVWLGDRSMETLVFHERRRRDLRGRVARATYPVRSAVGG